MSKKRRQNAYPATKPKLKDTDMKKEVIPEKKEQPEPNVYDAIRAEARAKQKAENERTALIREFMESGGRPLWEQKLNR